MRPLALRISGLLKPTILAEQSRTTVILDQIKPPRDTELPPPFETLYLYFAFVIRGTERPFLPTFAMDDWGNEVRKLSLYGWIYNDGDRFPRTELFGYEQDWSGNWGETQRFLREFELSARYPTYVTTSRDLPLEESLPVDLFGLIDEGCEREVRMKRPAEWPMPLKRTVAKGWQLKPAALTADTLQLYQE